VTRWQGVYVLNQHEKLFFSPVPSSGNAFNFSSHTLTDASKKVGLEVNADETKYMLPSRHQNAGQNHGIKLANRCFETVTHLRTTIKIKI
jgi:hypothetical protein